MCADDREPGSPVEIAPGVRVGAADLVFTFARSSGPGGQNVNKRSTRATLRVAVSAIPVDERARLRLRRIAGSALAADGAIVISDGTRRSQRMNMRACLDRLGAMVSAAQREPKVRRPSTPSRSARARRVDEKKKRGDVKRLRRPPEG